MHPPDKQKLDKLIHCIEVLVSSVLKHEPVFLVYQTIDPYYYIQKIEELKLIYEATTLSRLPYSCFTEHYHKVYCQWRKDARWLNGYVRNNFKRA